MGDLGLANDNKRVCYFISPHGFGHATRAAAVIRALQRRDSGIEVDVVTTAPKALFEQSVERPVGFIEYAADVGLVQSTPFHEDLPATIRLLDDVLPFEVSTVKSLVERFSLRDYDLVVCDIAPLGIAVAHEAAVPSLLVENFTWDWIYEEFVEEVPEIAKHIAYLEIVFESADHRIRTEPVCGHHKCDLTVPPVFREPRLSAAEVRALLDIPRDAVLVLVTLGGTSAGWVPQGELSSSSDMMFVVPTSGSALELSGNVVRVPASGDLYHPDLIRAADAVITKLGYSTIAEAYGAGVPVGYVTRPRFRESSVMERFIEKHMAAREISAASFADHDWSVQLSELLSFVRGKPPVENGAREIAQFVTENIFGR
jgi:UDP:flavonoid glycosyltransferase YjiC (YdhE family)